MTLRTVQHMTFCVIERFGIVYGDIQFWHDGLITPQNQVVGMVLPCGKSDKGTPKHTICYVN